jgi:hypothetical protein
MIRQKPSGHSKIIVYLIEANPLAARELTRSLRKGLGIHALVRATPFNSCTTNVQSAVYIRHFCAVTYHG